MNDESNSIFENFFADVFKSLQRLDESDGISAGAETDTRTKRYAVPYFSQQELTLKNKLLSMDDNTVKDHSIIAFLLSDNFISNIKQTIFNAKQLTEVANGYKVSIFDWLDKIVFNPISRNAIKESDPDRNDKAARCIRFLCQPQRDGLQAWILATRSIYGGEHYTELLGKGQAVNKIADLFKTVNENDLNEFNKSGPIKIDGHEISVVKKNARNPYFDGRNFVERKPVKPKEKVRGFYDILKIFYEYAKRLADNKNNMISLYNTVTEIKNNAENNITAEGINEKKMLEAFFASDFGSKHTTFDGRHIDSEKLYNELKRMGVNIEQLDKCAAFHINLINDTKDGQNSKKLVSVAEVTEMPDLTDTNYYIMKLIKSGKNTVDQMLDLSNIVKTRYDEYVYEAKRVLKGKDDNGSNNPFIKLKTTQWKTAASLMDKPVTGLVDVYSILARLWLFVKNEYLGENMIFIHYKQLFDEMNNSSNGLDAIKFKLILKAQDEIKEELNKKRLIWKNAFIYAQTLALDVDRSAYGTTEFQGKTTSGRTINYTYRTDSIFKLIEDLKMKFAFMVLNTGSNGELSLMDSIQSYEIPRKGGQDGIYASAIKKNFKEYKDAEFKLKISDMTFKKFVSDLTNKKINVDYNYITLDYGKAVNEYRLNSNLIIKFKSLATKTMVYLKKIENSSTPIQIEIVTNPGLDRIERIINLLNTVFDTSKANDNVSDINHALGKEITEQDREIPPGGNFYPFLQKMIHQMIVFAKDALMGKYNPRIDNSDSLTNAAIKNTIDAIFGKTDAEIDVFVNYCANKFVFNNRPDKPVTVDDVYSALVHYSPSILYEFLVFDFKKYAAISQKQSEKYVPEKGSEIAEKFEIIRQHINSNFRERINKSNIRTLDAADLMRQMITGKEFGRVVNTLMRKTLGPTDVWISTDSAFKEIEDFKSLAFSESSKDKSFSNHYKEIVNKIKDAFSKILNLSNSDKRVSYAYNDVSLLPDDFVCTLDWENDGTSMTKKYYKYMQIMSENHSAPPASAFKGAKTSENILKNLYQSICEDKFKTLTEDYPTMLALKYVILYYYALCLGEYLILELNYGKTFETGNVEMSKTEKAKSKEIGSQTLTRTPIPVTPVSGSKILMSKNPTAADEKYEDEPESADTEPSTDAPI